MSTKKRLAFVLLPAALGGILLAAWLWREPLARLAVNAMLAGQPFLVTELQALQWGQGRLGAGRVEVLLTDSGQRLVLTDIALGYRRDSFFAVPLVESLRLETVRLEAAGLPQIAAASAADSATSDLASYLALLRDFPVPALELAAVWLPGWQQPLALQLQARTGELDAVLKGGTLEITGSFQQPSATAPAQMTLVLRDGATSADLEFTLLSGADPSRLDFSGNARVGAWAPAAATRLEGLRFEGGGTIAMSDTALLLRLEPGYVLTLAALQTAAARLADLTVAGTSVLDLQADTGSGELRLEAATLSGAVATLAFGEWSLASAFDLRDLRFASTAAVGATLQLATSGLTLSGPQAWLPPFDIDVALALDGEHLSFSTPLRLRAAAASDIQVQGNHDLASGSGEAQVTLPEIELGGANNSLATRLGGWPWDADLLGGTLAAQLALQWQSAATTVLSGSANARLADVAGFYGSSFFAGLATVLDADIDTAAVLPVATPPLTLTLAELDVGLPLRNLTLKVHLEQQSQSIVVDALYGELLDGTISASDQRFRIGSVDNALTLQFNGFRLERLLELAEYEGVQASGAVSGEVPLVFSAAGIEVAGGRLFAVQPGGSIRYLGAAGNGQGNAALDIMNRALSNYQFETLESSIEYSPDGELVLSMQLVGRNPDMDNGRQVNLNLNLSDNIPALLRSLRAGREIEDFLEQRYR